MADFNPTSLTIQTNCIGNKINFAKFIPIFEASFVLNFIYFFLSGIVHVAA